MIRQCFLSKTGIRFHGDLLRAVGLDPSALYPEVRPRPEALEPTTLSSFATEEQEDLIDSLCPIYDQLALAPYWWGLEFWLVKQRVQDEHNHWKKHPTINLGRGRQIHPHKHNDEECVINVHRSVKTRLEFPTYLAKGKYSPNARMTNVKMNFVD